MSIPERQSVRESEKKVRVCVTLSAEDRTARSFFIMLTTGKYTGGFNDDCYYTKH